MLSGATVEKFKASLRGELIQRNDPYYDKVRELYNGMIDKRPLMIAHCADVADVISACGLVERMIFLSRYAGEAPTARVWEDAGSHAGDDYSSPILLFIRGESLLVTCLKALEITDGVPRFLVRNDCRENE
jgi:hypothetical protein